MSKSRLRPVFDDSSPYVDRFGLVLAITATSVVVLSLVDLSIAPGNSAGELGAAAAFAVVGVTVLLSLRASGLARGWQRIADILVIVGVLVIMVLYVGTLATESDLPWAESGTPPVVTLSLAVLAPVVIIRRLARHPQVSIRTLLGALSAYLLIPVAYFYAYLSVSALQDGEFFGRAESTQSFMYFSLSSVTTLGYGDLVAVGNVGRLLATSEALVGQVYLVTVVAMLVGMLASRWRSAEDTRSREP